jgi:hypothetical protein
MRRVPRISLDTVPAIPAPVPESALALEEGSRHAGLSNDAEQGATPNRIMQRDWNRDGAVAGAFLHDAVAALLSHGDEAQAFQKTADFFAGRNQQSTQPGPRLASRIPHRSGGERPRTPRPPRRKATGPRSDWTALLPPMSPGWRYLARDRERRNRHPPA